ncbi:dTDP-4-dehydrorhamnose reductase [Salinicola peritrichatus]|uniref:dTDP-4-dehydrorhamnose reductase n=1 Tax=Salinicola peritrichatus TaxID=1267424 RepID=UPI000DA1270C|nr:dTDP-4-dehydrorhamnose reductase [Salinicola peritrichatus]
MKILLLGASGQVGFELQRTLAPLGRVDAPNRPVLDLSDAEAVEACLRHIRPSLIVNASAWTAVDAAETQRDAAFRLNTELPAQLAAYASHQNIPLVHYSSDYVYPGDGEVPWREESVTGPLSVYGASKLAGDEAIQASGCRYLIFRTSWVYSGRGSNFMGTMLHLGREREALEVVADQIGAPTPARLIAEVTLLALQGMRQGGTVGGLYHLAPRGETSWHGFACEIFRLALARGERLAIVPERVAAISTAQYPTPAQRPLNSRLDLTRLEAALGIELPHWRSQLALTMNELSDHDPDTNVTAVKPVSHTKN